MIKTSIIIPTYNRGQLLCNTLRNLIGQLPTDGEIIVVDQSDEVCSKLMKIVKNHSAQIHYYKIFIKGLPHARNYGLRRAIGEIIIFCDDDVIPSHNFIENHLQNYKEKDVGGVGGRIVLNGSRSHDDTNLRNMSKVNLSNYSIPVHPHPNHPPSREKESFNLSTHTISSPGGRGLRRGGVGRSRHNKAIGKIRWWDAHLIDNFDATERAYIDHAQSCNMSFRKEAVIKARGFDERFGGSAHLEDTDLCLRIRGAGYKIVFDPKAELIHLKDTKGGCRAENYKQWFYWYGHNNMLFFLKNFSRYLFPIFFASSFIRLILSACKRYNPMVLIWGIRGYQNGLITYKSSSFSN